MKNGLKYVSPRHESVSFIWERRVLSEKQLLHLSKKATSEEVESPSTDSANSSLRHNLAFGLCLRLEMR